MSTQAKDLPTLTQPLVPSRANEIMQQQHAPTAMQSYVFSTAQSFEAAQRMATALSKSDLVPKDYKDKMPNALVALEVAQRIGASPLMVMQNLNVIHGRPSWSSQFIIAAVNSCGRFKPLRFKITTEEKRRDFEYEIFETEWVNREKITKTIQKKTNILNQTCKAWTEDSTGEILESPTVSIEMACLEGWYDKSGSKWKTMPELMLRYRAAAFFGRLYAPEVLMGMQTSEEIQDYVGADNAKDITPRDVIEPAVPQSKPPHDPATGEIIEDVAKQNQAAATSTLQEQQKPAGDAAAANSALNFGE